MNQKIKILVAEPSLIIRKGLVVILKHIDSLNIEIYEISDIGLVEQSIHAKQPDILIVNPSSLGCLMVPQIKKEHQETQMRFVALHYSVTDEPTLSDFDEVVSLYDNTRQIEDKITKLIRSSEVDRRRESLSPREKEVISHVVEGLTNKEIADKLSLSIHTIITHRRNIAAKLNINSVAGLTIYAIVNKLVDLDEVKE